MQAIKLLSSFAVAAIGAFGPAVAPALAADAFPTRPIQLVIPFAPGDTVIVSVNVVEGTRKRVQAYEGVVIAKRNRGLNSSFIVRKISSGEGVERTFQLYSPLIASIEVKRRGDVRRAKLYYLRNLKGKAARLRERE